mgnify:CR=1 FL=1
MPSRLIIRSAAMVALPLEAEGRTIRFVRAPAPHRPVQELEASRWLLAQVGSIDVRRSFIDEPVSAGPVASLSPLEVGMLHGLSTSLRTTRPPARPSHGLP